MVCLDGVIVVIVLCSCCCCCCYCVVVVVVVQVVLLLLEYSAHIDAQDHLGNTPLHLACSNGHMETTALLLMVTACGRYGPWDAQYGPNNAHHNNNL